MKLQDLTKNKKYPCILDIKMGFSAINQKDDLKFENSTSSSLGFRICGMNVYQPLKKCTIFKDKYWGRQISQDSLQSCFSSFFCDGEKIRFGLIHKFIKKLKNLKEALEYYKGYKFRSSSLLFIYDGDYTAESFKTTQDKIKSNKLTKTPYYSLYQTKLNQSLQINKNRVYSQQIQKKQEQNSNNNKYISHFILENMPLFTLENNNNNINNNTQNSTTTSTITATQTMTYKPLLLQNLQNARRYSALQFNISNFQSDSDKQQLQQQFSNNVNLPFIRKSNSQLTQTNIYQQLQFTKNQCGLSLDDKIKINNEINLISKPRSISSDSSQSSISNLNQSIDKNNHDSNNNNKDNYFSLQSQSSQSQIQINNNQSSNIFSIQSSSENQNIYSPSHQQDIQIKHDKLIQQQSSSSFYNQYQKQQQEQQYQQELEINNDLEQSFSSITSSSSSSSSSYNSYKSQGSDNNFDKNQNNFTNQNSNNNINNNNISNNITQKQSRDILNKSLISSHSQECISFKQNTKPRSILKLIDFANIEINENGEQPDLELIQGINNLISLFQKIIEKEEVTTSFLIENQQLFQQQQQQMQLQQLQQIDHHEQQQYSPSLKNQFILE